MGHVEWGFGGMQSKKNSRWYIIGTPGNQEQCEAIRTQIKKPRGAKGEDDEIWADPCYGPFYFRRVR
jgi:hypothetical protein